MQTDDLLLADVLVQHEADTARGKSHLIARSMDDADHNGRTAARSRTRGRPATRQPPAEPALEPARRGTSHGSAPDACAFLCVRPVEYMHTTLQLRTNLLTHQSPHTLSHTHTPLTTAQQRAGTCTHGLIWVITDTVHR